MHDIRASVVELALVVGTIGIARFELGLAERPPELFKIHSQNVSTASDSDVKAIGADD